MSSALITCAIIWRGKNELVSAGTIIYAWLMKSILFLSMRPYAADHLRPVWGDVTRWYRQFARLARLERETDYEVDERKRL